MDLAANAEISVVKKFRRDIWSRFLKAVKDYELICEGDRVAVFAGEDISSALAAVSMQRLWRYTKVPFELTFIGAPELAEQYRTMGIEPDIQGQDGSREEFLARAQEKGYTKLVSAEDHDVILETILSGVLFRGEAGTMLPKERIGELEYIRPLYLVRRAAAVKWAAYNGLSLKPGVSDQDALKARVLLNELREKSTAVDMNVFRSMENVNLCTLISYRDRDGMHSVLGGSKDRGIR